MKKILGAFVLSMFISLFYAQENPSTKPIKVFLDCQTVCYSTYLKENLSYVEFVRDRHYADVHIIINSQQNGSGGDTYYLEFFGQNDFKDIHKKLIFNTSPDDPDEIIRKKLMDYIILGLTDFWLKAGWENIFTVRLIKKDKQKEEPEDPWNKWVFNINAGGWANGSENYSSMTFNTGFTAKQVKEKTKFRFGLRYNKGKNKYHYNNRTFESIKESFSVSVSEILAINDHWSYGFFSGITRSVYKNYKFSGYLSAGLEYNFFPYSQSSKHSLTLSAKLGTLNNKYFEKTIYEKIEETVFDTDMSLGLHIIRKWGDASFSVSYHQFLHDAKLRSFSFYTNTNFRIFKGLSLYWSMSYSIQHDQINVAGGNLSLEELLLRQKELLSGFNYFGSIGIRYSFGSIYNTIVNPRFGTGGGRVVYFF